MLNFDFLKTIRFLHQRYFQKILGDILKMCKKTGVSVLISTAQKKKFFINDFFSKCDQIRSWSHLLKKSLMVNLIYVQ